MTPRASAEPPDPPAPRARCRCDHLPTHHMVVAPTPGEGSYRLEARGPCAVCGAGVCAHFEPGAP